MASTTKHLLAIACALTSTFAYLDFGPITRGFDLEPQIILPRPHRLLEDLDMRFESHYASITAIAPAVRFLENGTRETFWSMHYNHRPSHTITRPGRGLFRRGVFSGDPPAPSCTPCGGNSSTITNSESGEGSPSCSVTDYTGVFRSGDYITSTTLGLCYNSGYSGPLQPGITAINTASIPCCPVCFPPGVNVTGSFTSGVFSSMPITSSSTIPPTSITMTASPGSINTNTITVTATTPTTRTVVTVSVETITPSANSTGSPTVTTVPDTVIGCGTAYGGCGTVYGIGTVYVAPFGFPAVTSSGTVSGCAPTVIGCGTMIATTGTFTGTATVTGCGEGSGSATMIGEGTVWPAGFMNMISFVSSGSVTGSGSVKGCGTLIGSGTFTISQPYITTVTPRTAAPTVNVYISYCPSDPIVPMLNLAGNVSSSAPNASGIVSDDDTGSEGGGYQYEQDALLNYTNSTTPGNTTTNGTTMGNPLCHICPQDSGICCPWDVDCGADGHCPWTALVACGYVINGFNIVNAKNSSGTMGMQKLAPGVMYGSDDAQYRAPGLPGSIATGSSTDSTNSNNKRDSKGKDSHHLVHHLRRSQHGRGN